MSTTPPGPSSPSGPSVTTSGVSSIVYGVSDLEAAKQAFTALLGDPPHDSPYYVGWEAGGQQIGLDPNAAAKGALGPVPYWSVEDVATALDALKRSGATVLQEPTDVGGGVQVALASGGEGVLIGLIKA